MAECSKCPRALRHTATCCGALMLTAETNVRTATSDAFDTPFQISILGYELLDSSCRATRGTALTSTHKLECLKAHASEASGRARRRSPGGRERFHFSEMPRCICKDVPACACREVQERRIHRRTRCAAKASWPYCSIGTRGRRALALRGTSVSTTSRRWEWPGTPTETQVLRDNFVSTASHIADAQREVH